MREAVPGFGKKARDGSDHNSKLRVGEDRSLFSWLAGKEPVQAAQLFAECPADAL